MNTITRALCLVPFAALLSACATTGTPEARPEDSAPQQERREKPVPVEVQVSSGKITLEQETSTLGDTVRRIGEAKAGGIVLMNGLAFETIQPISWKGRRFDDAVAEIAQQANAKVDSSGGYAFIHPEGYEALNTWDVDAMLPPEAAGVTTSAAFGHGTKLSSVLAFLSNATGVTLLSDNAVADSRTGELWLPTMPLPAILEAILKSARIPPDFLTVQTAPGLAMFRSRGNRSAAGIRGESPGSLQEKVTVYLPQSPPQGQSFPMVFNATPLQQLLPALATQLGMPVRAGDGIGELPVEQCAFINQPRATIIEYLINQWPAPGIGYRWDGEGIVIERQ